jgi:hypothetical protein
MICSIATVAILSACAPSAISDKNSFLVGFINHELVAFMGVLVTITLASAANIHIELNKYDEQLAKPSFERTRADLKHSSFALVAALIASIFIVLVKPLAATTEAAQAGFNGAALVVIAASIMIVIDLTLAAFSLRPPSHRS